MEKEIGALLDKGTFDFKALTYKPGPEYQKAPLIMVFTVKPDLTRRQDLSPVATESIQEAFQHG